jgi:hypothetical protein
VIHLGMNTGGNSFGTLGGRHRRSHGSDPTPPAPPAPPVPVSDPPPCPIDPPGDCVGASCDAPEPGSMLLIGVALGAMGWIRRRSKSR